MIDPLVPIGNAQTDQAAVAELAKANEVLRRSVDRLSSATQVSEILGAFVAEAVEASGAAAGAILRRVGKTTFELAVIYKDGQVVDPAIWSNDAMARRLPEISAEDPVGFWAGLAEGKSAWCDIRGTYSGWFDENVTFHERMGHQSLWDFPFKVQGEVAGMLGLAFRHRQQPSNLVQETVRTVANTAALALQMTRLGEQARDTAVAREREAAARAHAQAVERLVRVGRGTLQSLAEKPDLEAFLGQVLRACASELGAMGGGIWRMTPGKGATLIMSLENGEIHRMATSKHPGFRRFDTNLDPREGGVIRGKVNMRNWSFIQSSPWFDQYREYYKAQGIRAAMNVPVYLGSEYRAALTLRFSTDRTLTPDEEQLALALANQIALALELTRLTDEARKVAVADERNRLAREIHDTLAQGFTGVLMQLGAAESKTTAEAWAQAREHLEAARDLAKHSLAEARRSVAALRPAGAERENHELDLVTGMRELVTRLGKMHPHPIGLEIVGEPQKVEQVVAGELLRIAQEAIHNAVIHAHAQNVRVTVAYTEACGISMTVSDDGRGFSAGESPARGFGLTSMADRAAAIDAKLHIDSTPQRGTTVQVTWQATE
ncbi:MAG TPA: GAF domain-containing sensor histidine kinase [Tepidisphaeraceae bacterium]